MSFAMPPLRHALALSAAATLVATAAFALTTTAPSAHATTNRRLCMYVNSEHTNDQKTRYVVVNYKKDGECPYINRNTHPTFNFYANPVPKRTCEEISAGVEFESKYYGDLCNILNADIVYELFKRNDKPFDPQVDVFNLGHVNNFR